MKIKFILLSFLVLFTRGCDFYSTSLWYFDNPDHESNPLASVLGFGWNGLIIANCIIVGVILYAHYYYSFKYKIKLPTNRPLKLTEYISETYYNQKNKFYQVFYRLPKNKSVLIAHNGYVLTRATIFGSLLATFHNLCLYHEIEIYDAYNRLVLWPEYVVYGLIVICTCYFTMKLWKAEFTIARNMFNNMQP